MAAEPSTFAISMRAMTQRDIRAVRRIERAAFEDAWPVRTFETELRNGFADYFLAVRPGAPERLLGYAGVWYMPEQLHLVTIGVHPDDQGRGIGSRLLLEVFRRAERAELASVALEVRASNERARALYARFGFDEVGTRRGYYQDNGEDAVVMLTPPLDDAALRATLDQRRRDLEDASTLEAPSRDPGPASR
jgi:ribosomal-protein-alanine N-acetyltransferase